MYSILKQGFNLGIKRTIGNTICIYGVYQYIGRTLRSQIDDGSIGGGGASSFAWFNRVKHGLVSGSSQIVLNDADKTGFDTADVAEGTNKYYTDTRVRN